MKVARARGTGPQTASFTQRERMHLLAQPGVGVVVVQRLEQAGYDSVAIIRRCGVRAVVADIAAALGTKSWANRTGALERAICDDAMERAKERS